MRIGREARAYAQQRTGEPVMNPASGCLESAFTRADIAEAFQAGMRFHEQRTKSIGKLAGAGKSTS